jgi:cytochrome P450
MTDTPTLSRRGASRRRGAPPASAPAIRTPPTVAGARFVGSAIDMRRAPLDTLERARRDHGDVVRLVFGPRRAGKELFFVFHPEGIRRVLATEADRYRKDNRFYEEVRWALGDGLLNSQDDRWLRQRRFIQPLFTRRRIAGYAASMAEEAADLVAAWRPVAAAGRAVDAHAEMSRLTLRVVGRLLFGADVERAVPVVRSSFPLLGRYARSRAFAPVRLPREWPTPANRRALRARRAIRDVCDELIARRRAAPEAAQGDDLLGLLVAARDGDEALDDAEIRDQILIFMLAGHDTTAVALTFSLHLLGRHPEILRRLQAEVDDVLGDRTPTADDVARLPYAEMVIKEAMRLYPPAPATGRRTAEGDVICGLPIPPGSDVALSPWVTHRHPDFWPEPERFEPERFAAEREADRHRHAYFPFGAGPRACIGQYFSMLEAAIALAAITRAYDVSSPDGRIPLTPAITLHPDAPVPCTLTARR